MKNKYSGGKSLGIISSYRFFKKMCWNYLKKCEQRKKLRLPKNRYFSDHVRTEKKRVLDPPIEIVHAGIPQHLEAAVSWVLRAQASTPDGGVSVGYFPLKTGGDWMPSYPETTGYIITSLLKYAKSCGRDDVFHAAVQMANWEIDVQMQNGAVQGGPLRPPDQQTPAAFNTGMVLDGWCSLYEATRDQRYLVASIKAADFLVNDLDSDGYFQTNGDYVSQGEIKTYTCLCAWAMYRAGELTDRQSLKDAAIKSVEAALKQQKDNGWFAHNCLTLSDVPLTHTIGYTLQGIFEVGVLTNRPDFIEAAEKALIAVVSRQESNGFLSGRFNDRWQPTRNYVCLTGSCQLAIVCYRMAEQFSKEQYLPYAHKLVNFVKRTQLLESENPAMQGGIAGSFPIMEEYMDAGYPNWATKYFIDALMLQNKFK